MGSTPVANLSSCPKREGEQKFFGAMYLEMAEPVQSLMAVKSLAGAVVEASKSMKYQGLF